MAAPKPEKFREKGPPDEDEDVRLPGYVDEVLREQLENLLFHRACCILGCHECRQLRIVEELLLASFR